MPLTAQHTFFQHNGVSNTLPGATDATLALPFQWMTHLDRKLVNATELLHTATVPPHQLTHRFAIPNGAAPAFHRHDFQRPTLGADPAGALLAPQSPAYRLFDLLSVKPWGHGQALGGRVPGKVNINMLWDQDPTTGRSQVFDALLLANGAVPAGNGFLATDLTTIWTNLRQTRTPGFPNVGSTVHETGAPTDDRPFRALGSPMLAADGTTVLTAAGLNDTIFRPRTSTDTLSLFQRVDAGNTLHPYQSWEPLRKVFNNLTTTTDCYLVAFTIGYFEVPPSSVIPGNDPPFGVALNKVPRLGREVYNVVPGDMRAKYVGVVDRTQIGVDNAGNQVGPSWFADSYSAVQAAATASIEFSTPYLDGVAVTLSAGSYLRIGTGDAASGYGDGEWVTVTAATPNAATGTTVATISPVPPATQVRSHPAGSPVSNIFLRNPGPQAGFNVNDPRYKGVLPFVTKVEPTLP